MLGEGLGEEISTSSRLGKKERKYDSCRGVQRGWTSTMDRRVGEKCPK